MPNPFKRIRDFFRKPAMIGTPPSERSMWHDPAEHARDFAERYAEPMNYLVENRNDGARHPYRSDRSAEIRLPTPRVLAEETTGGGNVPGRRLTVDSGVFNSS